MRIVGIVVEYNPFHNGHLLHLEAAKRRSDDLIIAVMSGNFLQRGEPALLDKWTRAQMALNQGVDLLFELPFQSAVQSADFFATGAVELLADLGCEELVFGVEDAEIDFERLCREIDFSETSSETSTVQNRKRNYAELLGEESGLPDYARAILQQNRPNITLGLAYAKANQKLSKPLILVPIQRQATDYLAHIPQTQNLASATAVRRLALEKGWPAVTPFVPSTPELPVFEQKLMEWELLWPFLKYRLETASLSDLKKVFQMQEGLEYRFKKALLTANSFAEFLAILKTKRYTYTRLQRICTYVLLDVKQADMENAVLYHRLLAMSPRGQTYLNKQKKKITFPLITRVGKNESALLELDLKAGKIYQQVAQTRAQDFGRIPLTVKDKALTKHADDDIMKKLH